MSDLVSKDRGFAGLILLRLLMASWRVDYRRPPGGRTGRPRGRPVLYCLWHARQLPLMLSHRREGITTLISLHRDGDYVAKVAKLLGFSVVRGSSTRGGAAALKRMASVLRSGTDCAITPDGPRGPAFKAKPGLVLISRLGRRPAVPIAASGCPALVFGSWDSFRLPLPFARMTIVEGRPIPPSPPRMTPEQAALHVEREMARVTGMADFLACTPGRLFERVAGTAGRMLGFAAQAALIGRPGNERLERRGIIPVRSDRPVVLHGSSAGEVNGILPLAGHLASRGLPVHLTCFTPAGREAVSRSGLPGSFLPLDSPVFVERFLESTAPRALVIAETEIWPNLLMGALLRSVPCIAVNARLSESSLRNYRLLAGRRIGRLLSCFCSIQCRTPGDAERFESLGVDPSVIEVTGDTKALRDPGDPPAGWSSRFSGCGPVIVAGSTRPGEERAVALASRKAGLFPVIAPRHLERLGEVADLLRSEGFRTKLWSEGGPASGGDCILLDERGILARLYGCADVAFVGGTIAPFGGHNIMEPLLRGVPVVVGPSHGSFEALVQEGVRIGAVRVADEDGLADAFHAMASCGLDRSIIRSLGASGGREALDRFNAALALAGIVI